MKKQKGCCDAPTEHEYKCPHCGLEGNNKKKLFKHQEEKHKNKAIHFVIMRIHDHGFDNENMVRINE